MIVAFIIFALVFLVLAFLAFSGKINFVISSDKKDAEGNSIYDEPAISKFLGIVLLLLTFTAVLGMIGFLIKSDAMVIISPILFGVIFIGAFLYSGSGRRFLRRKRGRRYRK